MHKNKSCCLVVRAVVAACVFFMVSPVPAARAQAKSVAAKPGELLPNLAFAPIIGMGVDSMRLSSLRGKLVVLDFWSTYCSSCIKNMPKVRRLQDRFGDSILILPVYAQAVPPVDIDSFWQHHPIIGPTGLPTALDTSHAIRQYFPYKGVPHLVWIGPDGRFLQATSSSFMNEEVIRRILAGKPHGLLSKEVEFGR